MKDSSAIRVRFCPEAAVVGGHDGPTDGQAQPQALRFGAVERLEETIGIRRQPGALIANGGLYPAMVELSLKMEPSHAGLGGGHGVSAVDNEVQHELLELHAITRDR